jgi:hypothetical protein
MWDDRPSWTERFFFSAQGLAGHTPRQIACVSKSRGRQSLIGEHTKAIDTTGRTAMPGFDHLIASTWALTGLNLSSAKALNRASMPTLHCFNETRSRSIRLSWRRSMCYFIYNPAHELLLTVHDFFTSP